MDPYIVMIDDYVDAFPSDWPVTAEAQSRVLAEAVRDHDGHYQLCRRVEFRLEFIGSTSLIHTPSGRVDRAGVYKVLQGEEDGL